MFTKTEIKLASRVCEAIKKIAKANSKKWEWKPEWAEYIVYRGEVGLITGWLKLTDGKYYLRFLDKTRQNWDSHSDEVIPLFRWEKLEEILENWGYTLLVGADHENLGNYYTTIVGVDLCTTSYGKTRQEAVMRAIIKLGEEVDK